VHSCIYEMERKVQLVFCCELSTFLSTDRKTGWQPAAAIGNTTLREKHMYTTPIWKVLIQYFWKVVLVGVELTDSISSWGYSEAPKSAEMGSIEKACISGFLCRLCSEMHRTVIHIYSDHGQRLCLVEKINGYLPITVSIMQYWMLE